MVFASVGNDHVSSVSACLKGAVHGSCESYETRTAFYIAAAKRMGDNSAESERDTISLCFPGCTR